MVQQITSFTAPPYEFNLVKQTKESKSGGINDFDPVSHLSIARTRLI